MAAGRRERLLPIFIRQILMDDSSKEKHVTQKFVSERLEQAPYELFVKRRVVSNCINLLLDEELGIRGNSRDGYWYE